MIKAIITDFSRVLLFPKDKNYSGSLNSLHKELSQNSDYSILDHFELNHELLNFYQSLSDTTPMYVFTSDAIQDDPELQPYFQPIFREILSAKKMDTNKKSPEAYKLVADHLKLNPHEILYIDDDPQNIDAAKRVGLNTVLYKENEQTFNEVKSRIL